MSKLPVIKARDLIRLLKKLGFYKVNQIGSHAHFKHPDGRRTTVPIHPGKDILKKTLKSILKDIEVTEEEFKKLLKS